MSPPKNTTLFDWLNDTADQDMIEQYKRWDAKNPEFYPLFCRFTKQLIERGFKNIGVALIFERIRWESMVRTEGDPFKLNNNYRSIYARRFMAEHPEHEGVFRVRGVTYESEDVA